MRRPAKSLCKCGNQKSQVANVCLACARPRIAGKCKSCGVAISYPPSRPRLACGVECAYRLRSTGSANTQCRKIIIACERCGKERHLSPSNSNRRFCSTICAYASNFGARNRNWKGGITSEWQRFYTSTPWVRICRVIRKRDKNCCQRCGRPEQDGKTGHDVHHIAGWKHFPELRLDAANLILLCRGCHRFIHSKSNTDGRFIRHQD